MFAGHFQEGTSTCEEYGCLVATTPKEEDHVEEDPRKDGGGEPAVEEADTATEELMVKVKEGWTIENCHALTVGDVYLMVSTKYLRLCSLTKM